METLWVDSHCHLEDDQFNADRQEVLERARRAGVGYVITLGSDILSSRKAVRLARKSEKVYAGVGVHPHMAKTAGKRTFATLTKLAHDPKVVAIGEVGLDYYRDLSPRNVQQAVFRSQIRLARRAGLPLVLHEREAHDDLVTILREERAWEVRGVIHCFSGDWEKAQDYLELGFLLSIAGPVTFSKTEALQEAVSKIPLEYLLVETDAPFLTPVPYRGRQRNEPALLLHTAEKVAELKRTHLSDLARVTSQNAHALFGLPSVNPAPQLVYHIGNAIHVNLTYTCTNHCFYCPRFNSDFFMGYNLHLEHDPSTEELWKALERAKDYKEVVFSGYGEPCLRLDVLKELARRVKARGYRVRLVTNGHGNLIHGRNILPELRGLVDTVDVSLHAESAEKYLKIADPPFGPRTYDEVHAFIREAKQYIPCVRVAVPKKPFFVNLEECKRVVREELGAELLVRDYTVVA